jgi:hypothetical protein
MLRPVSNQPREGGPETGWDGPYYVVRSEALEVRFLPHPHEALDDVSNIDAEVRLPDGSRWSATIVTATEVARLMDHWADTGEALGGRYFWCSDGLVVKEPGVMPMAQLLTALLASGELPHILKPINTPKQ